MSLSATVLQFPLAYGLPFHTSWLSPCHPYLFNLSFLWASLGCLCPVFQQELGSLFRSVLQYQMYGYGLHFVLSLLLTRAAW